MTYLHLNLNINNAGSGTLVYRVDTWYQGRVHRVGYSDEQDGSGTWYQGQVLRVLNLTYLHLNLNLNNAGSGTWY